MASNMADDGDVVITSC